MISKIKSLKIRETLFTFMLQSAKQNYFHFDEYCKKISKFQLPFHLLLLKLKLIFPYRLVSL